VGLDIYGLLDTVALAVMHGESTNAADVAAVGISAYRHGRSV